MSPKQKWKWIKIRQYRLENILTEEEETDFIDHSITD